MNINNFKEYVNKTILKRGYDYYTDRNILDTCNDGDNTYTFEVQGSEDYQVVVQPRNFCFKENLNIIKS